MEWWASVKLNVARQVACKVYFVGYILNLTSKLISDEMTCDNLQLLQHQYRPRVYVCPVPIACRSSEYKYEQYNYILHTRMLNVGAYNEYSFNKSRATVACMAMSYCRIQCMNGINDVYTFINIGTLDISLLVSSSSPNSH